MALYIALSRPNKIATMTLYEPSAFHLLRRMGEAGGRAFAEMSGVARRLGECIVSGDYRAGVADFIDYWGNPGHLEGDASGCAKCFDPLVPKGPPDFHALIEDPTPEKAYRLLNFPVLICAVKHAPLPTLGVIPGRNSSDSLPRSPVENHRRGWSHGPANARIRSGAGDSAHIARAGLESGQGSLSFQIGGRCPLSANSGHCQRLFDYFIGESEQCRWQLEAEIPYRRKVDDQLGFVGRRTGKSPGLAPWRIVASVYSSLRNRSGRLAR